MDATNNPLARINKNTLLSDAEKVAAGESKHQLLESFLETVGGEEAMGKVLGEQFNEMVAAEKFVGKPQLTRQWFDSVGKALDDRNKFDKDMNDRINEKEQAELMEYIKENVVGFLQANPQIIREALAENVDLLKKAAKVAGFELVPYASKDFLESKDWTGNDDDENQC